MMIQGSQSGIADWLAPNRYSLVETCIAVFSSARDALSSQLPDPCRQSIAYRRKLAKLNPAMLQLLWNGMPRRASPTNPTERLIWIAARYAHADDKTKRRLREERKRILRELQRKKPK